VRLNKLKLSGFKSFVEPTTVLFPGQLAGVVGPNGCGKSNIIDAVRWVLGESKASELRGESIQDVIFKGSGNRKEVSRASVELYFDNAEGRAAGQWSQYAEITVKRVLDREGNSSYYINNLHVRRRDVIDLFLGTGLGPRAYAIIGQGMISRIVEAKPDELRFFLEEAAGVTKYKERRKETEHRLEDARENIARVDDIRNELEAQVNHLQGQAAVAQQYRGLHQQVSRKQTLLWLKKRNDARTTTSAWRAWSKKPSTGSKPRPRNCAKSRRGSSMRARATIRPRTPCMRRRRKWPWPIPKSAGSNRKSATCAIRGRGWKRASTSWVPRTPIGERRTANWRRTKRAGSNCSTMPVPVRRPPPRATAKRRRSCPTPRMRFSPPAARSPRRAAV
jgi:energy-coupling factor transporter ATP-binding protein EcfA2